MFTFYNFREDRENDKKQNAAPQLTTVLLQNTGKLCFPNFNIIRQNKIFQCRDHLIQFETTCALESQVSESVHEKKFESALDPVSIAQKKFKEILEDEPLCNHVRSLPVTEHFLKFLIDCM